jgi:hypothetical protein
MKTERKSSQHGQVSRRVKQILQLAIDLPVEVKLGEQPRDGLHLKGVEDVLSDGLRDREPRHHLQDIEQHLRVRDRERVEQQPNNAALRKNRRIERQLLFEQIRERLQNEALDQIIDAALRERNPEQKRKRAALDKQICTEENLLARQGPQHVDGLEEGIEVGVQMSCSRPRRQSKTRKN